ncbi:hypothetical protein C8Q75DRAFT_754443 [Abortiporus biennis]|nr:hypothetical protein C8Q75DRAFT_754443 [Abortiporus biennis]
MARTRNQLAGTTKASNHRSHKQKVNSVLKPPKNLSVSKVSFAGQKFQTSPVFDTFWWFVAERHCIHQRRVQGEEKPWTEDPILSKYPFTNVYRVYDRVTQFVLNQVIEKGDQGLRESFFRVTLFRTFNKISTWEHLQSCLGDPFLTWRRFDIKKYEEVLRDFDDEGNTIYGKAYIMPAPKFGHSKNYENHLRLIKVMMEDRLPEELSKLKHLKDAHGRIGIYPSMGDFMALQLLLDLNMLPHYNFSEHEWSALGPGSLGCIHKMFGPSVRGHEEAALRYLYSTQMSHFTRLNIPPSRIPRLCKERPAGLSMVDIEHALCECEKYSRVKFPEIKGGRRVELRRLYIQKPAPLTADLPDKWRKPRVAPRYSEPPPMDDHPAPMYEVSHIVAEKKVREKVDRKSTTQCYLVRWVGYDPVEDTWMSAEELEGAPDLLGKWNSYKERINTRIEELD